MGGLFRFSVPFAMTDLDQLVQAAQADFDAAPTPAELENAKARFLGKAGRVTELLKGLAKLAPDEKKTRGAEINQAKGSKARVDLQAGINKRGQFGIRGAVWSLGLSWAFQLMLSFACLAGESVRRLQRQGLPSFYAGSVEKVAVEETASR